MKRLQPEKLLLEQDEDSSENVKISYKEDLGMRQWQRKNLSGYMDCKFILGSAAGVEILWFIAKMYRQTRKIHVSCDVGSIAVLVSQQTTC